MQHHLEISTTYYLRIPWIPSHSIPKYRQPTTHVNKIHAASSKNIDTLELVCLDAVPSWNMDNLFLAQSKNIDTVELVCLDAAFHSKISSTYNSCKQNSCSWCSAIWNYRQLIIGAFHGSSPLHPKNNDNLPAMQTILIHNLVSTCKGATNQCICYIHNNVNYIPIMTSYMHCVLDTPCVRCPCYIQKHWQIVNVLSGSYRKPLNGTSLEL